MTKSLSQWLQYLYFLRFSMVAWLSLPFLCLLDGCGATSTITRGILTVDSGWQAFHACFFIVALNMAVLVTARNTMRNGPDRFKSLQPAALDRLLTCSTPRKIWTALGIAHLSTLVTLLYLVWNAFREEMAYPLWTTRQLPRTAPHTWIIAVYLIAGIVAALFFWYVVSVFYYWTYRSSPVPNNPPTQHRPAVALIFPYGRYFGNVDKAVPPPRLIFWVDKLTRPLLRTISFEGYAASDTAPVWELHFFSALSLLGIFLLYLFLYPLTAPVTRDPDTMLGEALFGLVVMSAFLYLIGNADVAPQPGIKTSVKGVKRGFVLLTLIVAGSFLYAIAYDVAHHSVRMSMAFPTLASILVLLVFFLWFFSGAAFFLDRYRIPVLATVLACIFVPKILEPIVEVRLMKCWPGLAGHLDSDHYFAVKPLSGPLKPDELLTPAQIIQQRIDRGDGAKPYIVVTAAGGGIQAAEWTAQIMAKLETDFANNPELQKSGYTFHDHLVLASGVSGGSVGLMPYLLEYTAHQNHGKDPQPAPVFADTGRDHALHDRMTWPSKCSSLEAVGWGLVYHDLYQLLSPVRLSWPDTGNNSYDRSWALTTALNRNLHDEHCETDRRFDAHGNPDSHLAKLFPILDGDALTLGESAKLLAHRRMPAFTFNTTAAETGSRFLLSNYRVDEPLTLTDLTPAQSFLQVYASDPMTNANSSTLRPALYADLPLAVAARLSATFPIVSSGTRIPPLYTPHAYHFLDGGYYDNDGTASAIEFMHSAIPALSLNKDSNILLIEIRDDDGQQVTRDADTRAAQNAYVQDPSDGRPTDTLVAPPWSPFSQLTGIAAGLWNAGHVSISRRNRRELCIFEKANEEKLNIHHVVFTIRNGGDGLSPLSWNLTTGQINSILGQLREKQEIIDEAVKWTTETLKNPQAPHYAETCAFFR